MDKKIPITFNVKPIELESIEKTSEELGLTRAGFCRSIILQKIKQQQVVDS